MKYFFQKRFNLFRPKTRMPAQKGSSLLLFFVVFLSLIAYIGMIVLAWPKLHDFLKSGAFFLFWVNFLQFSIMTVLIIFGIYYIMNSLFMLSNVFGLGAYKENLNFSKMRYKSLPEDITTFPRICISTPVFSEDNSTVLPSQKEALISARQYSLRAASSDKILKERGGLSPEQIRHLYLQAIWCRRHQFIEEEFLYELLLRRIQKFNPDIENVTAREVIRRLLEEFIKKPHCKVVISEDFLGHINLSAEQIDMLYNLALPCQWGGKGAPVEKLFIEAAAFISDSEARQKACERIHFYAHRPEEINFVVRKRWGTRLDLSQNSLIFNRLITLIKNHVGPEKFDKYTGFEKDPADKKLGILIFKTYEKIKKNKLQDFPHSIFTIIDERLEQLYAHDQHLSAWKGRSLLIVLGYFYWRIGLFPKASNVNTGLYLNKDIQDYQELKDNPLEYNSACNISLSRIYQQLDNQILDCISSDDSSCQKAYRAAYESLKKDNKFQFRLHNGSEITQKEKAAVFELIETRLLKEYLNVPESVEKSYEIIFLKSISHYRFEQSGYVYLGGMEFNQGSYIYQLDKDSTILPEALYKFVDEGVGKICSWLKWDISKAEFYYLGYRLLDTVNSFTQAAKEQGAFSGISLDNEKTFYEHFDEVREIIEKNGQYFCFRTGDLITKKDLDFLDKYGAQVFLYKHIPLTRNIFQVIDSRAYYMRNVVNRERKNKALLTLLQTEKNEILFKDKEYSIDKTFLRKQLKRQRRKTCSSYLQALEELNGKVITHSQYKALIRFVEDIMIDKDIIEHNEAHPEEYWDISDKNLRKQIQEEGQADIHRLLQQLIKEKSAAFESWKHLGAKENRQTGEIEVKALTESGEQWLNLQNIKPDILELNIHHALRDASIGYSANATVTRNMTESLVSKRIGGPAKTFFKYKMPEMSYYGALIYPGHNGFISKKPLERIGMWKHLISEDMVTADHIISLPEEILPLRWNIKDKIDIGSHHIFVRPNEKTIELEYYSWEEQRIITKEVFWDNTTAIQFVKDEPATNISFGKRITVESQEIPVICIDIKYHGKLLDFQEQSPGEQAPGGPIELLVQGIKFGQGTTEATLNPIVNWYQGGNPLWKGVSSLLAFWIAFFGNPFHDFGFISMAIQGHLRPIISEYLLTFGASLLTFLILRQVFKSLPYGFLILIRIVLPDSLSSLFVPKKIWHFPIEGGILQKDLRMILLTPNQLVPRWQKLDKLIRQLTFTSAIPVIFLLFWYPLMWLLEIPNIYTLMPMYLLGIGVIASITPSLEFIFGKLTDEIIEYVDILKDPYNSFFKKIGETFLLLFYHTGIFQLTVLPCLLMIFRDFSFLPAFLIGFIIFALTSKAGLFKYPMVFSKPGGLITWFGLTTLYSGSLLNPGMGALSHLLNIHAGRSATPIVTGDDLKPLITFSDLLLILRGLFPFFITPLRKASSLVGTTYGSTKEAGFGLQMGPVLFNAGSIDIGVYVSLLYSFGFAIGRIPLNLATIAVLAPLLIMLYSMIWGPFLYHTAIRKKLGDLFDLRMPTSFSWLKPLLYYIIAIFPAFLFLSQGTINSLYSIVDKPLQINALNSLEHIFSKTLYDKMLAEDQLSNLQKSKDELEKHLATAKSRLNFVGLGIAWLKNHEKPLIEDAVEKAKQSYDQGLHISQRLREQEYLDSFFSQMSNTRKQPVSFGEMNSNQIIKVLSNHAQKEQNALSIELKNFIFERQEAQNKVRELSEFMKKNKATISSDILWERQKKRDILNEKVQYCKLQESQIEKKLNAITAVLLEWQGFEKTTSHYKEEEKKYILLTALTSSKKADWENFLENASLNVNKSVGNKNLFNAKLTSAEADRQNIIDNIEELQKLLYSNESESRGYAQKTKLYTKQLSQLDSDLKKIENSFKNRILSIGNEYPDILQNRAENLDALRIFLLRALDYNENNPQKITYLQSLLLDLDDLYKQGVISYFTYKSLNAVIKDIPLIQQKWIAAVRQILFQKLKLEGYELNSSEEIPLELIVNFNPEQQKILMINNYHFEGQTSAKKAAEAKRIITQIDKLPHLSIQIKYLNNSAPILLNKIREYSEEIYAKDILKSTADLENSRIKTLEYQENYKIIFHSTFRYQSRIGQLIERMVQDGVLPWKDFTKFSHLKERLILNWDKYTKANMALQEQLQEQWIQKKEGILKDLRSDFFMAESELNLTLEEFVDFKEELLGKLLNNGESLNKISLPVDSSSSLHAIYSQDVLFENSPVSRYWDYVAQGVLLDENILKLRHQSGIPYSSPLDLYPLAPKDIQVLTADFWERGKLLPLNSSNVNFQQRINDKRARLYQKEIDEIDLEKEGFSSYFIFHPQDKVREVPAFFTETWYILNRLIGRSEDEASTKPLFSQKFKSVYLRDLLSELNNGTLFDIFQKHYKWEKVSWLKSPWFSHWESSFFLLENLCNPLNIQKQKISFEAFISDLKGLPFEENKTQALVLELLKSMADPGQQKSLFLQQKSAVLYTKLLKSMNTKDQEVFNGYVQDVYEKNMIPLIKSLDIKEKDLPPLPLENAIDSWEKIFVSNTEEQVAFKKITGLMIQLSKDHSLYSLQMKTGYNAQYIQVMNDHFAPYIKTLTLMGGALSEFLKTYGKDSLCRSWLKTIRQSEIEIETKSISQDEFSSPIDNLIISLQSEKSVQKEPYSIKSFSQALSTLEQIRDNYRKETQWQEEKNFLKEQAILRLNQNKYYEAAPAYPYNEIDRAYLSEEWHVRSARDRIELTKRWNHLKENKKIKSIWTTWLIRENEKIIDTLLAIREDVKKNQNNLAMFSHDFVIKDLTKSSKIYAKKNSSIERAFDSILYLRKEMLLNTFLEKLLITQYNSLNSIYFTEDKARNSLKGKLQKVAEEKNIRKKAFDKSIISLETLLKKYLSPEDVETIIKNSAENLQRFLKANHFSEDNAHLQIDEYFEMLWNHPDCLKNAQGTGLYDLTLKYGPSPEKTKSVWQYGFYPENTHLKGFIDIFQYGKKLEKQELNENLNNTEVLQKKRMQVEDFLKEMLKNLLFGNSQILGLYQVSPDGIEKWKRHWSVRENTSDYTEMQSLFVSFQKSFGLYGSQDGSLVAAFDSYQTKKNNELSLRNKWLLQNIRLKTNKNIKEIYLQSLPPNIRHRLLTEGSVKGMTVYNPIEPAKFIVAEGKRWLQSWNLWAKYKSTNIKVDETNILTAIARQQDILGTGLFRTVEEGPLGEADNQAYLYNQALIIIELLRFLNENPGQISLVKNFSILEQVHQCLNFFKSEFLKQKKQSVGFHGFANMYLIDGRIGQKIVEAGPNAWFLKALVFYQNYENKGHNPDTTYNEMTRTLARWLVSLQEKNPAGKAFYAGIRAGEDATQKNFITEHQLSVNSAFNDYYQLSGDIEYKSAALKIENFIKLFLFDSQRGVFIGGIDHNLDKKDIRVPLDVLTWAMQSLGPSKINSFPGTNNCLRLGRFLDNYVIKDAFYEKFRTNIPEENIINSRTRAQILNFMGLQKINITGTSPVQKNDHDPLVEGKARTIDFDQMASAISAYRILSNYLTDSANTYGKRSEQILLAKSYWKRASMWEQSLTQALIPSRTWTDSYGLPQSSSWGVNYMGRFLESNRIHTSATIMYLWSRSDINFNPFKFKEKVVKK